MAPSVALAPSWAAVSGVALGPGMAVFMLQTEPDRQCSVFWRCFFGARAETAVSQAGVERQVRVRLDRMRTWPCRTCPVSQCTSDSEFPNVRISRQAGWAQLGGRRLVVATEIILSASARLYPAPSVACIAPPPRACWEASPPAGWWAPATRTTHRAARSRSRDPPGAFGRTCRSRSSHACLPGHIDGSAVFKPRALASKRGHAGTPLRDRQRCCQGVPGSVCVCVLCCVVLCCVVLSVLCCLCHCVACLCRGGDRVGR